MDFSKTFAISAAGMSVERARVEAAASNLANANTVQGADGAAYQPVRVLARTAHLGAAAPSFADQVETGLDRSAQALGVPEAIVETTGAAPRRVYEPGHPLADAQGFISYPGVDSATEMIELSSALRSYEANLAAMNTARTLALRTLEIGSGQ
ncbi:MAG: flagellar basal body rod protein FlgC [Anaeromyxobacter sp.]